MGLMVIVTYGELKRSPPRPALKGWYFRVTTEDGKTGEYEPFSPIFGPFDSREEATQYALEMVEPEAERKFAKTPWKM